MQLSFRTLSIITSLLCLVLALAWGFFPQLLLAIWSIEYSSAAGFVARRSAVLFAALGVMFYLVRSAQRAAVAGSQCPEQRVYRRLFWSGGTGFWRMAERPHRPRDSARGAGRVRAGPWLCAGPARDGRTG